MKKKCLTFVISITLLIAMILPTTIYANMAAPMKSDIASSITFEKNDDIAVLSEVLDITVKKAQANIVATYKMKNTTNKNIVTQSMFLSPNINNDDVRIIVNNEDVSYKTESYGLSYGTEIVEDGWQYVVLNREQSASLDDERTVDTLTFEMSFLPEEEYDVVVSYSYNLGGYPDYNFDAKDGVIEYYLAPAAMWKDFSNLTINLYLDKDMPIIKDSNLEFKKVASRTYQYSTDTLPEENLRVVIDENWLQNIFSTLRSPYLPFLIVMMSPFILIPLIIIIILHYVRKRKKRA